MSDMPEYEKIPLNFMLSAEDKRQLSAVHGAWQQARAARDFVRADRLRRYLENAGCMGPDLAAWHPVFEEMPHRQRRLKAAA